MNPERPVVLRTSASARDIWTRDYRASQISPDGRILSSHRLDNSDTPFGRQIKPVFPPHKVSNVSQPSQWPTQNSIVPAPHVMTSRECEQLVYQTELFNVESDNNNVTLMETLKRMKVMEKENKFLHQQFARCLKINAALTQAMQHSHTYQRP